MLGTATLTDGSVHFPITGGNVTVYKKGAVDPYVQGDIQHNGSGLSLTAGSTTVQLQNFDINPGSSQAVRRRLGQRHGRGVARLPVQPRRQHPAADHDRERRCHADRDPRARLCRTRPRLLDKTFNTTAVKGGLLVGIATIVVNTK